LVQNALKFLLQFGQVSYYLGYNAMEDFFPKMILRPNPNCDDANCRQRQREYLAKPKIQQEPTEINEEKPVHEDNEWGVYWQIIIIFWDVFCSYIILNWALFYFTGISLVEEQSGQPDKEPNVLSTSGVRRAYTIPKADSEEEQTVPESTGLSLEELMAEMKAIWKWFAVSTGNSVHSILKNFQFLKIF